MSMTIVRREQAQAYAELHPLIELCRSGKLFEVKAWIASGKPIDLPPKQSRKGAGHKSPLGIAISTGFHSLVQILLEAGAAFDHSGPYCSMKLALKARRMDLVELLVDRGYDIDSVDMREALDTWDPQIIQYLVAKGASLERGNPIAYALICRNPKAIPVFKRNRERLPGLQEQINIALRHHCRQGDLKWAAQLLSIGADPYAGGEVSYDTPSGGGVSALSALAHAMIGGHYGVFDLEQVALDPTNPVLKQLVPSLYEPGGPELVERLIKLGLEVNDGENGGSSYIRSLLCNIDLYWGPASVFWDRDNPTARAKMELVQLLVKHGARWRPSDSSEIISVRRSLLKLKFGYVDDLTRIMAEHGACPRAAMEELLRTPKMQEHIARCRHVIGRRLASLPE